MSSYTKRNSTGNTPARSTAKKSRRRRTILHEEYDELSLKRMGADNGTSSIVVGQSKQHSGRELTKSSMRDLEGVEATRQPLDDTPATSISSNSQSLHSAIKRTAPVELWDDIKYPNYNENPFEFEAINRISNYTYEEPRRYNYWHYLYNSMDWFNKCDSTKLRRGGSIVFVVAIVVLSAVLIGLAIPNEGSVATHGDSSNSTSPATPKHKPVRTNQQGGVDKYTPQQLLELAEQITTSCNSNTITHEESRRICQSLCMDRMCCFEDDKYGCKEEEICAVYIGCESLFWSEAFVAKDDFFATNLLQLADEIIGYCDEYLIDPQSADGKECVKRCKDHMCCFENFNGRNNCKQDELTCQLYEGCEMLVGIQELEDASLLDESA